MLHLMNITTFDLNRAKTLHYMLEEAHVGRAAARLGITPAAASNALRRLRDDLGDPLLVKRGRGLVRTRLGEELRGPAREVVAAAEVLLRTARPFDPYAYSGDLSIALAEHVAAFLLPSLDRLARELAPRARLAIAAVPLDVVDWLKKSGGILVGPAGPFAATMPGDSLVSEEFYPERYVCVMRHDHPLARQQLTQIGYAGEKHVLVVPRGLSMHSDVDDVLAEQGLQRNISRVVPSFQMAIPIICQSDLIIAMPERSARNLSTKEFAISEMPVKTPPLPMRLIMHPAHIQDGRIQFIKALLRNALEASMTGLECSSEIKA